MTSHQAALTGLNFSLVGPGKVGSSLAHWATTHGATVSTVAGRTLASARELTEAIGGRPTTTATVSSGTDDLLLISVGDPELAEVVDILSPQKQASVVLHTSGRNPASVLASLRTQDTTIGSIHPLKAFPRILQDPGVAAGVVFGIDGDAPASALSRRLATTWSGIAIEIPPEARSLYHLAATTAAGGVITLVASAVEVAETIGLDPHIAQGLLRLAEDALDQARSADTSADAITGPVARGDLSGFENQLVDLRRIDPELARLLDLLARRTLHLRNKTGSPRRELNDP